MQITNTGCFDYHKKQNPIFDFILWKNYHKVDLRHKRFFFICN